jgi:hypothetical protein
VPNQNSVHQGANQACIKQQWSHQHSVWPKEEAEEQNWMDVSKVEAQKPLQTSCFHSAIWTVRENPVQQRGKQAEQAVLDMGKA